MAYRKEWDTNPTLTSWINIPGLEITCGEETGAVYQGIYYPEMPPICSCGWIGRPDGFQDPRTVFHIVRSDTGDSEREDNKPKIISIVFRSQKYVCPVCKKEGKPKPIPYEPEIARKGACTTLELDNYIFRQCLDRSPKKVEASLGVLSDSTITSIFKDKAEEAINSYSQKLIAPHELGLHLITVAGTQYFLISDIEEGLLIDIFQKDDFTGVVERLSYLAFAQETKDVLSEIRRPYLVTVRGVFRKDAVIRAATASICREYARTVLDEMDQRYTGRGKKSIGEWLSAPLFDDLPICPEVNRVCQQLPFDKHHWLRSRLLSYKQLRRIAIDSWTKYDFVNWIESVKRSTDFHDDFIKALSWSQDEIDNSFKNIATQHRYNEAERQATEIIIQNQKCGFGLMRERLLLKCNPKIIGHMEDGFAKYYYRGISMKDLAAMTPYEE